MAWDNTGFAQFSAPEGVGGKATLFRASSYALLKGINNI